MSGRALSRISGGGRQGSPTPSSARWLLVAPLTPRGSRSTQVVVVGAGRGLVDFPTPPGLRAAVQRLHAARTQGHERFAHGRALRRLFQPATTHRLARRDGPQRRPSGLQNRGRKRAGRLWRQGARIKEYSMATTNRTRISPPPKSPGEPRAPSSDGRALFLKAGRDELLGRRPERGSPASVEEGGRRDRQASSIRAAGARFVMARRLASIRGVGRFGRRRTASLGSRGRHTAPGRRRVAFQHGAGTRKPPSTRRSSSFELEWGGRWPRISGAGVAPTSG